MHKISQRMFVVLFMMFSCLPVYVDAAMTTTGKFAVSNSGAATFSVDIQVPPGTGGIIPSLSIDYNSDDGNGLVGLGGSIGGFSAITRCARTMSQDGARGGIHYDGNDRFCLDGQRLIAIRGADGADGAEYRTEINVYARIKSFGTAGSGPAWFSVETKSGEILEYGNTADSRIEAQGKSSVAVWALNKRRDINTNYLTISYNEDTANGTYWPAQIDYTGNSNKGTAPYNSVKFNYIPRTDTVISYQSGSIRKETVVLQGIKTYAGASLVKNYTVLYDAVAPTQRHRMKSIQECAGNGNCLPAITMQPVASSRVTFSGIYPMANGLADDGHWDANVVLKGTVLTDINGDGLLDIVRMTCNVNDFSAQPLCPGTGQRKFFVNNGSSFVLDNGYADSLAASDLYLTREWHDMGVRMEDINGDGLPDIIQLFQRNLYRPAVKRIFLNTGTGFALNADYTASLADVTFYLASEGDSDSGGRDGEITSTQLLDINGDGLLDLVYLGGKVFLNNGSRFEYNAAFSATLLSVIPAGSFAIGGIQLADINGDGLPDVMTMATTSFYNVRLKDQKFFRQVALNTGSSFVIDSNYTNSVTGLTTFFVDDFGDIGTRLIDINGDGLPDLVQMYSPNYDQYGNVPQRRAYLNTGMGFIYSDIISRGLPDASFSDYNGAMADAPSIIHADLGLRFSDLNGDGLVDLIRAPKDGKGSVWLNTGAGFAADVSTNASLPSIGYSTDWVEYASGWSQSGLRFPDINGDGLPDIVYLGSLPIVYLNQYNSVGNRLASFTQLGASTKVAYGRITDKSIYVKDSGTNRAVSPNIDEQFPMYVTASATKPTGTGGTLTTAFTYGGLKTERDGRGGLGFRWIDSKQMETGMVTHREFSQMWPYIGLDTVLVETLPGSGSGGVIRSQNTSYQCIDHVTGSACTVRPLGIYFPYPKTTTDARWDLSGALMPVVTTTQLFDQWGNPTNVSRSTNGGFGKTTVNTYTNDETNWFLGRVKNSAVTATIP